MHTSPYIVLVCFRFTRAHRLYDECTYSNGLMRKKTKTTIAGGLNDYPCGGDIVMTQYLNMSAVRDALHVEKSEFFAVDNADGFDYTPTEPDLTSFYKEMNGKLRILVYNGGTNLFLGDICSAKMHAWVIIFHVSAHDLFLRRLRAQTPIQLSTALRLKTGHRIWASAKPNPGVPGVSMRVVAWVVM